MVKINKPQAVRTHEGAKARAFTPEQQLRRALMNSMLWESQFYEDGVAIAERMAALVPKVKPERVAALAIEAREDMKLRHAPLLIVREMARHETHRGLVADTLERIIQRPDELTEFLAIYWADALGPMQQRKKAAVSAQVKKGLARAFAKFDAYQLAKYDRDGAVRLRDVLFITHAKPKDEAQEKIWKQLVDGKLASPDTWEVALSGGADKKETFERLIADKKLGALVFEKPAELAALNAIVHPRVGALGLEAFAALAARGVTLACYEVPLLIENGLHHVFKPVVVVAADPETQRARIAARDGLSFSEADARIASQLPLSEKLKLADYVIENRGSLADLEARATEVLNAVQAETTQKA